MKTFLFVSTKIPVTYHCYRDDAERFNIVKDTIKQWVDPPSRRVQILIIDCEDNNQLFKHLKSENVPICEYKDYKGDEILFLHSTDAVEAIVSGAEWPMLIFHCKYFTFHSPKIISVMNKRIISRAISKVHFFTDGIVHGKNVLPFTEIKRAGNEKPHGKCKGTDDSNDKFNRDSGSSSKKSQLINDQPLKGTSETSGEVKVKELLQLISDYKAKKEDETNGEVFIVNDKFRIISASAITGSRKTSSDTLNGVYVIEEDQKCYIFNSGTSAKVNTIHDYLKEYTNILIPTLNLDGKFKDDSGTAEKDSFDTLRVLLDSFFAVHIPAAIQRLRAPLFNFHDREYDIIGSGNIEAMVKQFKDGKRDLLLLS